VRRAACHIRRPAVLKRRRNSARRTPVRLDVTGPESATCVRVGVTGFAAPGRRFTAMLPLT